MSLIWKGEKWSQRTSGWRQESPGSVAEVSVGFLPFSHSAVSGHNHGRNKEHFIKAPENIMGHEPSFLISSWSSGSKQSHSSSLFYCLLYPAIISPLSEFCTIKWIIKMKCNKAKTFFYDTKLKRLVWVSAFPEYLQAPTEEHKDWQNMEHTILK